MSGQLEQDEIYEDEAQHRQTDGNNLERAGIVEHPTPNLTLCRRLLAGALFFQPAL
jgi:hypothetical protein